MDASNYISLVAAAISICSFVYSWHQKSSESNRTARTQLTDLISKLDSVFAEFDKLMFENADKSADPYFVGRRSFLNGQKRFLARQAVYLMDQIPDLVTDFEYNRVADAFSSVGDYRLSDKYYVKAIEATDNVEDPDTKAYYASMSMRAFARSLFEQRLIEEGRKRYQESLDLIRPDTDLNRYNNAETHQRWALAEADVLEWNEAEDHINKARSFYQSIVNRGRRAQGLANLAKIEELISHRKNPALPEAGKVAEISS
jgi:tetratricopeptide (TPR) repeat protein